MNEVRRLRNLVEASFLLARVITHAISFEEAAPRLLEKLGKATSWDLAVLWRVEHLRKRLLPVGIWQPPGSSPSQILSRSSDIELSPNDGLAGRAWVAGQPLWVLLEDRPSWFHRIEEAERDGLHSGLAFPIRAAGEVVGVVELFSRKTKSPDADLLQALTELASPIGSVMEHTRSEEAQRLLSAASDALFGSLDYKGSLEQVANLCVPRIADVCAVHCLADDGLADQVAVAHVDPEVTRWMREQSSKFRLQLVGAQTVVERVSETGEAELIEDFESLAPYRSMQTDEQPAYIQGLGLKSAMLIPLRARGNALGVMTLATTGSRRYCRSDLALAVELARRASLAIDNARLFESERQARAHAEAATKAKDEFLAVLSHELRTPLQSMLGWTQMLRGRRLDDETAARGLAAIERATRAQAQLIGDLLDVSRIVAGKLSLDSQRLDLVSVIEGSIESVRATAEAKAIRIEEAFEIDSAEVIGDSHRLQQIASNLLSNALKFTDKGGRIVVRLRRAGAFVEFVVEDNGVGISLEFLPHIFERFRQADSTSRRAHGGLGLGLTIVQHIVELHGGTVEATSEGVGQGARFEVRLPLAAYDEDDDEAAPESVDLRKLPRLDGLRVLVVDDDAETREVIRTLLDACGANVTTVQSASLALDVIAASPPDLLISDVRMPNEDGYSFIRRVRARGEGDGGSIPAIALTADATGVAREHALAAGFQHHMAKPVQPLHLARVIASLCNEGG